MARITIAQLTAQLEASHVSYERLATQYGECKAALDSLMDQYHDLAVERDALKHPSAPARPQRQAPDQSAYRAACEAARAMAMKTGRCVRVG